MRRTSASSYQQDFERDGFDVVTAAPNATRRFRSWSSGEKPDLVVMDIRLPGDGRARGDEPPARYEPRIPVVLNSAILVLQRQLHELGGRARIVKSADTGELRTRVASCRPARTDLMTGRDVETLLGDTAAIVMAGGQGAACTR